MAFVEYCKGDMFASNAHALVNPVNCVGVMGKGLALEFKKRFPDNFEQYRSKCRNGLLRPGKIFVHSTPAIVAPYAIVNFPTKDHWKDRSRLEWITQGAKSLSEWLIESQTESIAIPMLGCGLGGLRWDDVAPKLTSALSDPQVQAQVMLFGPEPRS